MTLEKLPIGLERHPDGSVIVKGSAGAGLGDKIRAALVAAMYCRVTGRRIYVDWRDRAYGDGTTNYFDDLFRVEGLSTLDGLPTLGTVLPESWTGRLTMSLNEVVEADRFEWSRRGGIERYSFDQSTGRHDADHLVMWEMDQFERVRILFDEANPGLKHLDREELEALLFTSHFEVCEDVRNAVDEFAESHFSSEFATVGIHIRLTDESQENRLNPALDAFLQAARKVSKRARRARLFLATDNVGVIERFRDEFGASAVIVREKWMPRPGEHLHGNSACPDALQSARDALVDAFLLGRCDWLVSSNVSAFSWLARITSGTARTRKITLLPQLSFRERVARRLARIGLGLLRG